MPEETKTTQPEQQPAQEQEQKPDPTPPDKQPEPDKPEPPAPEPTQKPTEQPVPDEAAALRAQLTQANAERTAAIEAVKLGIDPKQVPYVLRLAELPDSGKPEDIAAALQKVLDDVPAFKAEAAGSRPQIRIGAKAPQENTQSDALARAFGNQPKAGRDAHRGAL